MTMRYIYKFKEICSGIVAKIKNWFRREPTVETLREELYTPEVLAIYIQTLEEEGDFKLILGSLMERMSVVTGQDLEVEVSPRA